MRPAFHLLSCTLALGLWGAAALAASPSAPPVGAARVIVAEVSAEAANASRLLAVDDPVTFNELIATRAKAAAVLALADGTELAMGENAQVRLDDFVLGDGAEARLSLTLNLGALRFATGNMPKPAYAIRTPQASLAVRGTVFDLAVGEDGAAYLAVSEGAVTVSTASGQSIDVPAGQSLAIDAQGVADLPRPAALAPLGPLPAKLAAMDQTLAEHLAELDEAALRDLSVLDPSRTLAHDLPGAGLKDQPSLDPKAKPNKDKMDGKDRPGKR